MDLNKKYQHNTDFKSDLDFLKSLAIIFNYGNIKKDKNGVTTKEN